MFNSTVLDVAVGLIFTFLAISLTVSAIVEAFASAMKWRSGTLLQGVKDLLNDSDFTGIALQIYNHALINPRDRGTATKQEQMTNLPSYINAGQFADALIDVTSIAKEAPDEMKGAIDDKIKDPQINKLLKGMVDRTSGDMARMRDEIAAWFDNGMNRVSGAYKRKTQFWSFVIALIVAIGINVDSIEIGKTLWSRPLLADTITLESGLKPVEAMRQLETLGVPVGWTAARFASLPSWAGVQMLLGCLITAIATLFGAPFWFDALGRIVRLRGTGLSPKEAPSGSS